jgi:hypothetical protein
MIKIKLYVSTLLLSLIFISASSQEKDFGVWSSIEAEKSLGSRFELSMEGALRSFKNSTKIDQSFFELGVNYEINKFLSSELSYRISNQYEDDGLYHARYKSFFALKSKISPGDFRFNFRLMFQNTMRTYYEDRDQFSRYYGRIKVKGAYDIPSFPLEPYLSAELFTRLYPSSNLSLGKYRIMAGAELKVTQKISFEAAYMYQRDNWPVVNFMNIVSAGLKFKI